MHDNRLVVEGRLARFVRHFLPAALYRERRPLAVEAWNVPGEPVPAPEAFAAGYAPVALPHDWGAPWATTWFHATGQVPGEWTEGGVLPAGTRLEIVIDLGFYGPRPGFQAEGLGYRADGTLIKAVASWRSSASTPSKPGCPTPSATRRRCRRSSRRRAPAGS